MRTTHSYAGIAGVVCSVALVLACATDSAQATTGYWDLFCVDLNQTGLYWNQVNGGAGVLNDPMVSPDPGATNPGSPVIDPASALGGVAYGYGGFDWGTGTLEGTMVANNSISMSGAGTYYLSVVLDTKSGPQTDQLYPSWGTISTIKVYPELVAGGYGAAISPSWSVSPYDPDSGTILTVNAAGVGDSVALASNDVGVAEGANQLRGIWGAGAVLPNAPGYKVDFDTNLDTWDSYNQAGPPPPPPGPQTAPHPVNVLPPCGVLVPGKEYSNNVDKNAAGVIDPLQNIKFSCTGNCVDTFDYSGSAVGTNPNPNENDNVDALANCRDAYFWAVANDTVPMVVSFGPAAAKPADIYYQMAQAPDTNGTWCTAAQICPSPNSPDDVDGLEVWGPAEDPEQDDADKFSLIADPNGVAVYSFIGGLSHPWITTAALQNALGTTEAIDLDALMCWDEDLEDGEFGGTGGTNDAIIFSVMETASGGGAFDGGELWLWKCGSLAMPLFHGGETWDTAHTVGADFNVATEEIDAVEAVPEPGTMLVLALGGGLVLIRRRRR